MVRRIERGRPDAPQHAVLRELRVRDIGLSRSEVEYAALLGRSFDR
jgi:hypothetical protein